MPMLCPSGVRVCVSVSSAGLEGRKRRAEMREIMKKQNLVTDNRGIGVVEIILILVILIGLVLLFQTQIKEIVNNALESISTGAGKVTL